MLWGEFQDGWMMQEAVANALTWPNSNGTT